MTIQPSKEILAHFGIKLVAPLGGRFNQHWLVASQREQRVLRLWGQSANLIDWASIHYEVRLMADLAAMGWPVAATVTDPVELVGDVWSLAPFLPGELSSAHGSIEEQRARGRLLAQFHDDLTNA